MSEKQPTTYNCTACGGEVRIIDGAIVRACDHHQAAVIASCAGVMRGKSRVAGERQ
jgi:competence CoiA-like predicted nuclease